LITQFWFNLFAIFKELYMNRVAVYDPFSDALPTLLRGFFQPVNLARDAIDIRMDVTESANEFVVHAEMPGVAKDDIAVQIDGNKVRISAEVKRSHEVKTNDGNGTTEVKAPESAERVLRSERYYGAVARSFALAVEVDEEKSVAKFENGVLTLTLPKKAAAPAKRLAIH
jgi:HSP20 family protein